MGRRPGLRVGAIILNLGKFLVGWGRCGVAASRETSCMLSLQNLLCDALSQDYCMRQKQDGRVFCKGRRPAVSQTQRHVAQTFLFLPNVLEARNLRPCGRPRKMIESRKRPAVLDSVCRALVKRSQPSSSPSGGRTVHTCRRSEADATSPETPQGHGPAAFRQQRQFAAACMPLGLTPSSGEDVQTARPL